MKRSIGVWQFFGFATTSFIGTLLHFLYEWLGESIIVAPFSGVNESTWEHMKLLFVPMFFYAIFQSFFFRDRKDFWCVKLRGMIVGLSMIPILFYTYNGAICKSPDWLNITIFFISAASAYIYETRRFNNVTTVCKRPRLAFTILCGIALLFIAFTFKAPEINIFKDPITNNYGI